MPDAARRRMTVEEFLDWAAAQPDDYELVHGRALAMSPERLRHTDAKGESFVALRAAIAAAGVACRAYTEGATVRVDAETAFRPDVVVRCGPRPGGDTVEIQDPVIVVEVASPSTRHLDLGIKFAGYFGLPSLRHYLLIDPEGRVVIHHRRDGDEIRSRILGTGPLRLDPPGLDLAVEDLFGPAEDAPA